MPAYHDPWDLSNKSISSHYASDEDFPGGRGFPEDLGWEGFREMLGGVPGD